MKQKELDEAQVRQLSTTFNFNPFKYRVIVISSSMNTMTSEENVQWSDVALL